MVKFPLPIDTDPEFAAALGRLIAYWGNLEFNLIHLRQILLDIDNTKARFIYQGFFSIRAKITLLKRLNHFYILDNTLKKDIAELLKETENRNEIRNSFVHVTWTHGSQSHMLRSETSLPGYSKFKKPLKKFTAQQVQKEVEDIAKLSLAFQNLILRLLGVLEEQP